MIDMDVLVADIAGNTNEPEVQRQLIALGFGDRLDDIAALRRQGRMIVTLDADGDLQITRTSVR